MSMTTELAQRMKAAALKATPGEWVYLPSNTSIEYDYGSDDSQGSITYMDSGDFTQKQTELNGIFIALANPANVLALVGALEAAEKRNAELEARAVKLPEPFKMAKSSSGLTYYYADEINEALTAAGIEWEEQ